MTGIPQWIEIFNKLATPPIVNVQGMFRRDLAWPQARRF
jgi:hypothetical protein